jgi:glycosyltransferase involved in cell wall biosynthesis
MLTTVYDLIPLKQGFPRRSILNRLGYSAYLHALSTADTLFAISDATAADLRDTLAIAAGRIVLAPPGIDLQQSSRGLPVERPYFLFVGGPNPNKNLAIVLDAMAMGTDWDEELIVAGHWLPKQRAELRANLDSKGLSRRVRHIGFVEEGDVVALMRGATALIVPSLSEGYGLPVGEGLAAGAVVIHSRLPVLAEVSSGAALTFDPNSATELAACLRQVVRNDRLRDDLRARGLARSKQLTWDSAVEATLNVYRSLNK